MDMEAETKVAFENIKELITEKFDNFEKRQVLRDENTNLRLQALENKDKEQDGKITAVINEVDRIREDMAAKPRKLINSINEKILSWLVPVVLLAIVYAIANGFKIGG